MMQACIRHAFVDLYVEHDVVRDIHAALQRQAPPGETIPAPPGRGGLDITEVLQSDFFFA
jgi:DNA-directed RNA polymerase